MNCKLFIKEQTMKARISLLVLLFSVVCVWAQSTTPTITFNVPLQLTSLHENVTEVCASCVGIDEHNVKITNQGRSNSVRPDANGNVNQTVTVTVTALTGKSLASAKKYMCSLGLKFPAVSDFGVPSSGSSHIELQPKPGTPFEGVVEGTVTW